MGITDAIILCSKGHSILSKKSGQVYSKEDLKPKELSTSSAVFLSGVLTNDEIKGNWVVK